MLASIIYNYGKFCDDFKSTLKLGAYTPPQALPPGSPHHLIHILHTQLITLCLNHHTNHRLRTALMHKNSSILAQSNADLLHCFEQSHVGHDHGNPRIIL